MKFLQWTFVVAFTAAICTLSLASDNCYDHQTNTYDARFQPTDCTSTCTVTPFFSPDTSVTTYVNLIESATESIDIFAPGKPKLNGDGGGGGAGGWERGGGEEEASLRNRCESCADSLTVAALET